MYLWDFKTDYLGWEQYFEQIPGKLHDSLSETKAKIDQSYAWKTRVHDFEITVDPKGPPSDPTF